MKYLIFVVMAIFPFNCSNMDTVNDYNIYEIVLRDSNFITVQNNILQETRNPQNYIIMKTTHPPRSTTNWKIDSEEINDFLNKNKTNTDILPKFSSQINSRIILLGEDRFTEIDNMGGEWDLWKYFYKIYPDSSGIIKLSKVGYNNSKTKAVMYYENISEYEIAVGYLYYLHLQNGIWKISSKDVLMIS